MATRNFVIKFHEHDRIYSIRDLGEGSGTFVKIEQPFPIIGTRIISFGDTHMVVKAERN
jgi:hypothetical protein